MDTKALEKIAQSLVSPGKGILAADESLNSTEGRFKKYNIPHTPENRQAYRDLMFATPGLEEYIDGVIMFDESIRQTTLDGVPFADYLVSKGIIPGIKVDRGYHDMEGFPGEKITEGLDGLANRLEEYYAIGARFTKWRAVIAIGEDYPTYTCLQAHAHLLARYALISQLAGMVPVVEPDVMMAGTHPIERCEEVTSRLLEYTFIELFKFRVHLEGILIKTNMILAGKECKDQASLETESEATARTLRRHIPAAVPGVVFLSGGQGAEISTARLNAIVNKGPFPWEVSFSFLRSLADPAYEIWQGKPENKEKGQQEFLRRARLISAARKGEYSDEMEKEI